MKSKGKLFISGVIIVGCLAMPLWGQTNAPLQSVGDRQVQTEPAQALSKSSSDDPIEWVKSATKKYSPASWELLMKYESMPAEIEGQRKGWWTVTMKKPLSTFDHLSGGHKKIDLIDQMALNIRVVDLALQRHDFFRYAQEQKWPLDWDNAEVLIQAPPDGSHFISFPLKHLFPSVQLVDVIPKDRQSFFFDTYIKGGSITQRFGVIGLLEEYRGYYAGSKYYYDMLDAYKTIEASETDGFFEWARSSQSTMGAFYELDYFIREYLLYMKKNRPADYDALKSYRPFVEALRDVRAAYEKLVDQYWSTINAEVKRLEEVDRSRIGLDRNGLLWIKSKMGKDITGTFIIPDREKLVAILNSDRYRDVKMDFPKAVR
jgi:hypothetical protein